MASPKNILAIVAVLASGQAMGANLYCCADPSTGRRVCADSVPEQCKGRGYKVLDSAGNVIKEVGPPLTPEQKAAKEAEAKRQKEIEAARREQQRKDGALLETYSSVNDIDLSRARAESEIAKAMVQAEKRIEEATKRRKKFEAEAEFYKKKELPPEVARGLRDADDEIKAQKALVESKQKDLEAVRAKFGDDKRRYLEITGRHSAPPTTPPGGRTQ